MDHHNQPPPPRGGPQVTAKDVALANEFFDHFLNATSLRNILGYYRSICDLLNLKPNLFPLFYPKLRGYLKHWRANALWKKFDARAAHKCYGKGKLCANSRVLIIGAGPCGLRTAIEAQLLGAKVVVIEKRDRLSRNNVLHLWPFVIEDLRALGAKKFFGKFCAGAIDHISIRQLQCILLKVVLLLGVEVHTEVSFERLVEPDPVSKTGWRAEFTPSLHPVSQYEFDVVIGADGKRNTLQGFKRKEFRGKLAIAITANFINKRTEAEARVEEISGVAFIFNQKFFKDLYEATGIDLENIVYYKDDTHYFVMTAKKSSLIDKGVIKQDLMDTERLLATENVNREALMDYAREAANFSTNYQMPDVEFAVNHYGQPDVAMFDFTSMYAAENASKVVERNGFRLLMILVGDSLLEPFWPTGSGCARGFLSSLDAAWAIRSWCSGTMTPLDVLAERESIYRLLAQTTPDNLNKEWKSYTLDPATRYPNLNKNVVLPLQTTALFDSDDPRSLEKMRRNSLEVAAAIEMPKKRRRGNVDNEVLLNWVAEQVREHDDVVVDDFGTLFKDGKVLCAILNHYRPDLVDYEGVKGEGAAKLNQLAIDILEREIGISPIMTGEELTKTEDYLAMATYLTQVYDSFRCEIPHIKHPKLTHDKLPEPLPLKKQPPSKFVHFDPITEEMAESSYISSSEISQMFHSHSLNIKISPSTPLKKIKFEPFSNTLHLVSRNKGGHVCHKVVKKDVCCKFSCCNKMSDSEESSVATPATSSPDRVYNRVSKWISNHDFHPQTYDDQVETNLVDGITDITSVTKNIERTRRTTSRDDGLVVEERTDVVKCGDVDEAEKDEHFIKNLTKFSQYSPFDKKKRNRTASPSHFSVIVEGEELDLPEPKKSDTSFKSVKQHTVQPPVTTYQPPVPRPSSRHKRHAEPISLNRQSLDRKTRKRRTIEKISASVDHENKLPNQTRGNTDEDFAARIKNLEDKWREPQPAEKKPKDLLRAIGKIETSDWNIKEIEKKIRENKLGKPANKDKEKVPKWSKEQFKARQTKMEKQHLDRQDSAEAKFADIDKNIKHLELKLKEGTARDLGQNKVASITEKFASKPPENADPKPLQKSQSRPVILPSQNASEFCHFCNKRVYLMERLSAEGRFFHHGCFKCQYCYTQLRLGSYAFDRDGIYDHKFFCIHHYGMQGELRATKVIRKPSQRHVGKSPEKKPLSGIAGVDLLDRVRTPERVEFANLSGAASDHEESLSQMDEDEWTDKNFGASAAELGSSDDESSSLSGSDSDDEDAYEEALEEPATKEGTLKWAERLHRRYSKKRDYSDSDDYSSSDRSSYYENSSDDDETDTATEGEEEIRARELRKQEVRVEPPVVQTDTGTDTEVKKPNLPTVIPDILLRVKSENDSTDFSSAISGGSDAEPPKNFTLAKSATAGTLPKKLPTQNYEKRKSFGSEFIPKFKVTEPEPLLIIKRTPSKLNLPKEIGKPKVALATNFDHVKKYFGKPAVKPILKRSETVANVPKKRLVKQVSLPDEKKPEVRFNFDPLDDNKEVDNYIETLLANEEELKKPIQFNNEEESEEQEDTEAISSSIEDLFKALKPETNDEKIEDLLTWMDDLEHQSRDRKTYRSFSDAKYRNLERVLKVPKRADSIISKLPKDNIAYFERHLAGKSVEEEETPKIFTLARSKTDIYCNKPRSSVDLDAVSNVDIKKVLMKFEKAGSLEKEEMPPKKRNFGKRFSLANLKQKDENFEAAIKDFEDFVGGMEKKKEEKDWCVNITVSTIPNPEFLAFQSGKSEEEKKTEKEENLSSSLDSESEDSGEESGGKNSKTEEKARKNEEKSKDFDDLKHSKFEDSLKNEESIEDRVRVCKTEETVQKTGQTVEGFAELNIENEENGSEIEDESNNTEQKFDLSNLHIDKGSKNPSEAEEMKKNEQKKFEETFNFDGDLKKNLQKPVTSIEKRSKDSDKLKHFEFEDSLKNEENIEDAVGSSKFKQTSDKSDEINKADNEESYSDSSSETEESSGNEDIASKNLHLDTKSQLKKPSREFATIEELKKNEAKNTQKLLNREEKNESQNPLEFEEKLKKNLPQKPDNIKKKRKDSDKLKHFKFGNSRFKNEEDVGDSKIEETNQKFRQTIGNSDKFNKIGNEESCSDGSSKTEDSSENEETEETEQKNRPNVLAKEPCSEYAAKNIQKPVNRERENFEEKLKKNLSEKSVNIKKETKDSDKLKHLKFGNSSSRNEESVGVSKIEETTQKFKQTIANSAKLNQTGNEEIEENPSSEYATIEELKKNEAKSTQKNFEEKLKKNLPQKPVNLEDLYAKVNKPPKTKLSTCSPPVPRRTRKKSFEEVPSPPPRPQRQKSQTEPNNNEDFLAPIVPQRKRAMTSSPLPQRKSDVAPPSTSKSSSKSHSTSNLEVQKEVARLKDLPKVVSDESTSTSTSSEIRNSATEISTDSEFAHDDPTPTRETPFDAFVTASYLQRPTADKAKAPELKLTPLVPSAPSIVQRCIAPVKTDGYALNRTQSTGGIAAKVSLELKKKYLLGETNPPGTIQKSGSASTLDTKLKSFHSNITDCQKMLKPAPVTTAPVKPVIFEHEPEGRPRSPVHETSIIVPTIDWSKHKPSDSDHEPETPEFKFDVIPTVLIEETPKITKTLNQPKLLPELEPNILPEIHDVLHVKRKLSIETESEADANTAALTETELSDWARDGAVSDDLDDDFTSRSNKKPKMLEGKAKIAESHVCGKETTTTEAVNSVLCNNLDIEFMDTGTETSSDDAVGDSQDGYVLFKDEDELVDDSLNIVEARNTGYCIIDNAGQDFGGTVIDLKPADLEQLKAKQTNEHDEDSLLIVEGTTTEENTCSDSTVKNLTEIAAKDPINNNNFQRKRLEDKLAQLKAEKVSPPVDLKPKYEFSNAKDSIDVRKSRRRSKPDLIQEDKETTPETPFPVRTPDVIYKKEFIEKERDVNQKLVQEMVMNKMKAENKSLERRRRKSRQFDLTETNRTDSNNRTATTPDVLLSTLRPLDTTITTTPEVVVEEQVRRNSFSGLRDTGTPPPVPPLPLNYTGNSIKDDSSDGERLDRSSCDTLDKSGTLDSVSSNNRQNKSARKAARQAQLKRHRMAQEIQRKLEETEVKTRELEERGVLVEKALRGEVDGRCAKEESELLQEWFDLMRDRTELRRYERELMVRAQEVELEDRHARLQHELRERLENTEEKTGQDVDIESSIIKEMMDIVAKRDSLIALLEEDRLRYSNEDRDFEEQVLAKGLRLTPIRKTPEK
ncbi:Protein-methionine sulfoxide oxidase Mical-like Protein [Tribolium castaneum]|uniref:F-actin monooxygenase n=1 Tax=Tribolium castaneum TaxID=7070 RepID=A0A139WJX4_TRICA|nr:Protein-methionine sulfoxide oxidase Mical-like Protein [Tribolium castaneum]